MTADPAAMRALAARVETEEPTEALNEDVAWALGWEPRPLRWQPDAYLTDLTAAASAMPEGWRVIVWMRADVVRVSACPTDNDDVDDWVSSEIAPTEPRARVAAALRARAAGMEAGE